jgi:hypothetical protein
MRGWILVLALVNLALADAIEPVRHRTEVAVAYPKPTLADCPDLQPLRWRGPAVTGGDAILLRT